jgi:hypothetical protein
VPSEREALEAVRDAATLGTFLEHFGTNLSVVGAKRLLAIFAHDPVALVATVLAANASDDAVGVLNANLVLPTAIGESLRREHLRRRRCSFEARHASNTAVLKTDDLEAAILEATNQAFIEDAHRTLAARSEEWVRWCDQGPSGVKWEDLSRWLQAQPRNDPPTVSSTYAVRALREALKRMEPLPAAATVATVMDRAKAPTAMLLLVALGVDHPRLARRCGHALTEQGRSVIHSLRGATLPEAAGVLAGRFPALWLEAGLAASHSRS